MGVVSYWVCLNKIVRTWSPIGPYATDYIIVFLKSGNLDISTEILTEIRKYRVKSGNLSGDFEIPYAILSVSDPSVFDASCCSLHNVMSLFHRKRLLTDRVLIEVVLGEDVKEGNILELSLKNLSLDGSVSPKDATVTPHISRVVADKMKVEVVVDSDLPAGSIIRICLENLSLTGTVIQSLTAVRVLHPQKKESVMEQDAKESVVEQDAKNSVVQQESVVAKSQQDDNDSDSDGSQESAANSSGTGQIVQVSKV